MGVVVTFNWHEYILYKKTTGKQNSRDINTSVKRTAIANCVKAVYWRKSAKQNTLKVFRAFILCGNELNLE